MTIIKNKLFFPLFSHNLQNVKKYNKVQAKNYILSVQFQFLHIISLSTFLNVASIVLCQFPLKEI